MIQQLEDWEREWVERQFDRTAELEEDRLMEEIENDEWAEGYQEDGGWAR